MAGHLPDGREPPEPLDLWLSGERNPELVETIRAGEAVWVVARIVTGGALDNPEHSLEIGQTFPVKLLPAVVAAARGERNGRSEPEQKARMPLRPEDDRLRQPEELGLEVSGDVSDMDIYHVASEAFPHHQPRSRSIKASRVIGKIKRHLENHPVLDCDCPLKPASSAKTWDVCGAKSLVDFYMFYTEGDRYAMSLPGFGTESTELLRQVVIDIYEKAQAADKEGN